MRRTWPVDETCLRDRAEVQVMEGKVLPAGSAAVDIIILVVILAGVLGSLHKESLLRGVIGRVDFIMFSHV
jgi:hypothetical protein